MAAMRPPGPFTEADAEHVKKDCWSINRCIGYYKVGDGVWNGPLYERSRSGAQLKVERETTSSSEDDRLPYTEDEKDDEFLTKTAAHSEIYLMRRIFLRLGIPPDNHLQIWILSHKAACQYQPGTHITYDEINSFDVKKDDNNILFYTPLIEKNGYRYKYYSCHCLLKKFLELNSDFPFSITIKFLYYKQYKPGKDK
uniref:Uncharacterized protein n=1 Tax=Clytia hemisphaerica TaxID=252671 RepID=A0A7M5UQB5_9CNID